MADAARARLSDLLQDDRFRGVCSVRLQARGYVVVPAGAPPREGGPPGAAPGCPAEAAGAASPLAAEGCAPEASSEGSSGDEGPAGCGPSPQLCERRTFLELAAPPTPRRPRSLSCPQELAHWRKRRCLSLDAEADQDCGPLGAAGAAGWYSEPAEEEAQSEEAAAAAAGALPAAARVRFCVDEPLPLEESGLLPSCVPLATPSPPCRVWPGHLQGAASEDAAAGARRVALCPAAHLDAVAEEGGGLALQTPSPVLQRRPCERLVVRLADLL
ncbi:unnamed protein product [Prorocentrum cordatum]|uniref:Uncharacterized protein n=1 Tax=Prorocentrum cordatum TaxID=2364126 RepID=A0ABN9W6E0_9DINO|nr:unnamed protein product [Polarella glacialis]